KAQIPWVIYWLFTMSLLLTGRVILYLLHLEALSLLRQATAAAPRTGAGRNGKILTAEGSPIIRHMPPKSKAAAPITRRFPLIPKKQLFNNPFIFFPTLP